MTRHYLVCVAGLSQELVERTRAISVKRFAPHGHLILKPHAASGYSHELASIMIAEAAEWARKQAASLPISVLLLYVDHGGEATTNFVQRFFPFALALPISPLNLSGVTDKRSMNSAYGAFGENLVSAAHRGRRLADAISHNLKDEHKTPVLLPVRNFRNEQFCRLLTATYEAVASAADVATLLEEKFKQFTALRTAKLPSSGKRCFSDGELYFAGPGKARHGYLRQGSTGHRSECWLSARSRLGGSYAFDFHFDCQPVRKLKAEYPNCHDEAASPKPEHVNIAPNDFVI